MNRSYISDILFFISIPFCVLFFCTAKVFGQIQKEKKYPIPDNVNAIFQTSCMPCHGSKGGRLPSNRLNFSRWAGYGAVKEAEKASRICSSVKKGTMPPRRVRELKPELILKKDQVELICKWAESLKILNKENK